MNIYELTGQWLKLQDMIESGEVEEDFINDTLDSLNFEIEEKAESIGLVLKNLTCLSNGLSDEITRLSDRKTLIEKNISNLEQNLLQSMIATGKTKFKTDHFNFSTRKSEALIVKDQELIPEQFIKEKLTISVDKAELKKAIKLGFKCEGAEIQENINISIK